MDFRDLMLWRWPPQAGVGGDPESAAQPLRALQADINRAFESFWGNIPTPSFHANWGMTLQAIDIRIDLVELENEIELTAEMPGLEERDIEVTLGEECITIKAEKHASRDRQGNGFRINERLYGTLQRTIALPAFVDQESVKATYRNGVLTVWVAKLAGAPKDVRLIPINKG